MNSKFTLPIIMKKWKIIQIITNNIYKLLLKQLLMKTFYKKTVKIHFIYLTLIVFEISSIVSEYTIGLTSDNWALFKPAL